MRAPSRASAWPWSWPRPFTGRYGCRAGSVPSDRAISDPVERIVDGPVATLSTPHLQARVGGTASKRGLIPRLPSGERLLEDVRAWLDNEYREMVGSLSVRALPEVGAELTVTLHPAAGPLVLRADDTGSVHATAETAPAGPGYHRFVGRVLERLGLELSIAWRPEPDDPTFADRTAVERGYLAWLGRSLVAARTQVRLGEHGVPLGLRPGTRFTTPSAVATVLGPRDEAWLETAIADPRVAVDVAPWWADATDGRYLLNRALCLMWTEARWRPPVLDEEAQLLDEIHRLLSRAFPLEPALPYPWHEWHELIGYRGIEDGMARQVALRAAEAPALDPDTAIGYRRRPVRISHEGWSLEIPGSFAERRTAEEWWGGGDGRSITLAATATGSDTGPMSPLDFLTQVAAELGSDALTHRDGPLMGRARLTTDASSGVEVGVVEGYSAVTGSGAAVRITFDDPADWQWALDTWRALRPG